MVRSKTGGGRGRRRVIVEYPAAGTVVAAGVVLLLLLLVMWVGLVKEVRPRGQDGAAIAEILVRRGTVVCKGRTVRDTRYCKGCPLT